MEQSTWLAESNLGLKARTGRARVRRLLLEQLRQAITTEPAALDAPPNLTAQSLTNLRGRVSIMIGTIVVRLNREGFGQSDRLYAMRDRLASGRPVEPRDLEWVTGAITDEAGSAKASGEWPAR